MWAQGCVGLPLPPGLWAVLDSGHRRGSRLPELSNWPASALNTAPALVTVQFPLCPSEYGKVSSTPELPVFENGLCSGHLAVPRTRRWTLRATVGESLALPLPLHRGPLSPPPSSAPETVHVHLGGRAHKYLLMK